MIDVWGADHSGHVKRMKAALAALTGGKAELDIKMCQLVRLFRGGEPVKMSKRAGTFVTLRDVVDEVGPGPVRFMMLYRKNDAPLDFDFVKVTEQSRDNPVFYVQYAHARASSVLRNVRDVFPDLDLGGWCLGAAAIWTGLTDEAEVALIRKIAQFPGLVEAAAKAHEPHRIAFYLYDIAGGVSRPLEPRQRLATITIYLRNGSRVDTRSRGARCCHEASSGVGFGHSRRHGNARDALRE